MEKIFYWIFYDFTKYFCILLKTCSEHSAWYCYSHIWNPLSSLQHWTNCWNCTLGLKFSNITSNFSRNFCKISLLPSCMFSLIIFTQASLSGLVCSCQNPTAWPNSCTTIPNLSQFLPIEIAWGPLPLFPTNEQHLTKKNIFKADFFSWNHCKYLPTWSLSENNPIWMIISSFNKLHTSEILPMSHSLKLKKKFLQIRIWRK